MTLETLPHSWVLNSVARGAWYLCGLLFSAACTQSELPSVQYATEPVRLRSLVDSILATGTIQTVASVEISSQLSGRIDDVLVDFNDVVTKEQPLAHLDQQRFASRVRELTAALGLARAEHSATEALLANAKVQLRDAERNLSRKQTLSDRGTISEIDIEEAVTNQMQRKSTVLSARAEVNTKKAAIEVAAEALHQAEIDLDRTIIRSPIAGIVIKRSIEPGQVVAATLEAPELFIIAEDLNQIEVHAKVDEADIGKVRLDQVVSFRVDAYPGQRFTGRVAQIRKAPDIVQNVVTYTVVIGAMNLDELMLPGMTAIVEITTMQKSDVIQIHGAAVQFQMPQQKLENEVIENSSVWILGDGKEPLRRSVKLGYSNGEYIEVLSGEIKPGDEVIIGYRQ